MAQQLVKPDELRVCIEELELAAARFREVVESLEKEGLEGVHLHWTYTSQRHIPGVTKSAAEALLATEDAIRSKRAGRQSRAEYEIERSRRDKRTVGRSGASKTGKPKRPS